MQSNGLGDLNCRCHRLFLPRKLSCAALLSSLRLLIVQAREKMRLTATWFSTVQQRTQKRVLEDHVISGKTTRITAYISNINYLLCLYFYSQVFHLYDHVGPAVGYHSITENHIFRTQNWLTLTRICSAHLPSPGIQTHR